MSLEQEKKENEELQSSIFQLSKTVANQDKVIADQDEEICQLREAHLSEKKVFQGLTSNFIEALKLECQ